MKALLFGSIGTLADTSELQREAFNAAFRAHGLDWHWDRDTYRGMLRTAGGAQRLRDAARGTEVDIDAVHATKSRLFQSRLGAGRAEARPGVRVLIDRMAADGVPVGLVTTTSAANVKALLAALGMHADTFAVLLTRADVDAPKPAPDCYQTALRMLGIAPVDARAIEDNSDGVRSAVAAHVPCIAWPNANIAGHDFTGARMAGDDITTTLLDGTTT